MKKLLFVLVLAFFVLSTQNVLAYDGNFYLGFMGGTSKLDTGISSVTGTASLDEEDTALKVLVGYEFNKYASIEFHIVDLGETSFKGNAGDTLVIDGSTLVLTTNNSSIASESSAFGLSGVFSYPLHKYFSPFFKVGLQKWETEVTAKRGGTTLTVTDDGTTALLGIGAKVEITEWVGLRLEYEKQSSDINTLTAGITFAFK